VGERCEARTDALPAPSRTLRDVFEEHAPFVCRSLRRLGVSEADLDDVLQEVFVVVHQRLPEYREVGRARAWLYSICRRLAQAQLRKASRRRESLMPEPPEEQVTGGQEERVQQRQALILGQQLLTLLSKEQREVFVLYEVEDMGMPEIAEALGCPLQTAYSRLNAARARIMVLLARGPAHFDAEVARRGDGEHR
jgi:RNA polymerase sigma-70 factor (ECF subfamily)